MVLPVTGPFTIRSADQTALGTVFVGAVPKRGFSPEQQQELSSFVANPPGGSDSR